jgi:large repetitive protein
LLNSNTATVNITVNPVNDAPVASNGTLTTNEDTPANATLVATDIDGNPLAYSLVDITNAHGTVQITNAATGAYTYTPSGNYNGSASFTFKANDGLADSNTATVNITVNPVNDAPTASNGTLTTNEDTPATGTLVATDVDGNALTFSLVDITNAHGLVLIIPGTGAYSYTPDANYNGPASFTFKANDGLLDSNIATVNITVNPVNDAPTASNGTLTTNEDTPATGTLVATDVDGNSLTFSLVDITNAHGLVLIIPGTGAYSYTPDANYNGPASFTFKANDGLLDSNIATVNITVNPVNDAPTLNNYAYSIPENTPNGTQAGTVTGSDIDGDTLAYSIVGGNTGGAFAVNAATGAITVANSAMLDYETTPVFNLTVRATDPGNLSDDATVTIRLTDVSEPPRRIGIDIQPGDAANSINIRSNGRLEVAILSTTTFNALRIDVDSLRFGRTGTEDSLSRNPAHGTPRYRTVDVNGDGRLDIVVTFEIELTGFQVGDALGVLTGRTLDGEAILATDMVSIRNGGR